MSHRKKTFARAVFLPYSHRENMPAGAMVYDVSSYGDHPWFLFSPLFAHGGIPVPGMPGAVSDSVEGIWQGLKVIRGKTALHLLEGRGQKRGGKPAGHLYNGRLIGLVEARQKIYRPAYEWMLVHKIDSAVIEGLVEKALAGEVQHFHDMGDNGDINNTQEAWAHASLVVQYINRLCTERCR